MEAHLSSHHRDTVEKIFAGANVEWRQVVSLLETVGSVTQEHNGKLKVTVGSETETLSPPHGKDVSTRTLVDLRRMLTEGGYGPGGAPPVSDQRGHRDHGDGRWGEPT